MNNIDVKKEEKRNMKIVKRVIIGLILLGIILLIAFYCYFLIGWIGLRIGH